jgi:predicted alpha-1,2-mannosidase
MTRFTPISDGAITILLDAGRSLGSRRGGAVQFISDSEVEGYNLGGGFCGEDNQHMVYFVARFSNPAEEVGTWTSNHWSADPSASADGESVGAWLRFPASMDSTISVKVGISYVSIANARLNLEAEMSDWDFRKLHTEARADWERELSRVCVEGGTEDDKTIFYSALYHMLIHPNIISDVNGEYPLMGRTGTGKVESRQRYSIFSLWDTYRTLHPFLALAYPGRQSEMVQTMLDMYLEWGWLPKWELAGNETYMMVGDPSTIVIADTWLRGIRDFDEDLAFKAMLKPIKQTARDSAPPIRAGYHQYLQYRYIPVDQDTTLPWWVWGPVSTTLEYCLADWTLSRVAKQLGKPWISNMLRKRSRYYRNMFDDQTMFLRPRLSNGRWLPDFDPLETEGSGYWAGSGGPGYVEGSAWNYTWFVPHDVEGLINLFSGAEPFSEKLLECFTNGQFTINNEPDIAYPYLFTYIPGKESQTRRLVRMIMNESFGTGADGLPGNDDAGTISGWYVFSALGFYPACPGADDYRLGLPRFKEAVIQLDESYYPGDTFTVETQGNPQDVNGLESILLNGKPLGSYRLEYWDVVSGGILTFIYRE